VLKAECADVTVATQPCPEATRIPAPSPPGPRHRPGVHVRALSSPTLPDGGRAALVVLSALGRLSWPPDLEESQTL
jgi:hypothetical protein